MQQTQALEKILANLDLSERERQIYLCLLKLKEAKLNQVITKTGLNKSTVHRVLKDLSNKGLVYLEEKKYDKKYGLYPPARLINLASNKRRKARRLELDINEALPQLKALYSLASYQPKVEIYDDAKSYTLLTDQSLESEADVIYHLGRLEDILEVAGHEYDKEYYIPTRLKKGIKYKFLTYHSPISKNYKLQDKAQNRETKFLPEHIKLDNTIFIFGNTVAFFSAPEERLALAITSPSFAKTQLTMFNILWDMSE